MESDFKKSDSSDQVEFDWNWKWRRIEVCKYCNRYDCKNCLPMYYQEPSFYQKTDRKDEMELRLWLQHGGLSMSFDDNKSYSNDKYYHFRDKNGNECFKFSDMEIQSKKCQDKEVFCWGLETPTRNSQDHPLVRSWGDFYSSSNWYSQFENLLNCKYVIKFTEKHDNAPLKSLEVNFLHLAILGFKPYYIQKFMERIEDCIWEELGMDHQGWNDVIRQHAVRNLKAALLQKIDNGDDNSFLNGMNAMHLVFWLGGDDCIEYLTDSLYNMSHNLMIKEIDLIIESALNAKTIKTKETPANIAARWVDPMKMDHFMR